MIESLSMPTDAKAVLVRKLGKHVQYQARSFLQDIFYGTVFSSSDRTIIFSVNNIPVFFFYINQGLESLLK